jgi:hypothetical protein
MLTESFKKSFSKIRTTGNCKTNYTFGSINFFLLYQCIYEINLLYDKQ